MKTEKPTPRHLRKESEKGVSYSSHDLTVLCILAAGTLALWGLVSLTATMMMYKTVIARGFVITPAEIGALALKAFLGAAMPVAGACIVAAVAVSLLQSRGVLATQALKVDFTRLNPVQGVKKLFALKVVVDSIRALLFSAVVAVWAWGAWRLWGPALFAQVHLSQPAASVAVWLGLGGRVLVGTLLAVLPLVLIGAGVDWWLHQRKLRMDKSEIKQEVKDTQGNPEHKRRRRDVAAELSAQVQADVAGSTVVLANPTHIALGIYLHDDNVPLPLVSVRESGRRARAVIALAERWGIPVVRDVRLARRLYARQRRYSLVHSDEVDEVMRLVRWLRDVERAGQQPDADAPQTGEANQPPSGRET